MSPRFSGHNEKIHVTNGSRWFKSEYNFVINVLGLYKCQVGNKWGSSQLISLFSWHASPMTYAKKIRISVGMGLGSEILPLFKSLT